MVNVFIFKGGSQAPLMSRMKGFMVQINAYSLLTIVTKSPILDVSGQLDLLLYTLYKLYRKVYGNLLSLWS